MPGAVLTTDGVVAHSVAANVAAERSLRPEPQLRSEQQSRSEPQLRLESRFGQIGLRAEQRLRAVHSFDDFDRIKACVRALHTELQSQRTSLRLASLRCSNSSQHFTAELPNSSMGISSSSTTVDAMPEQLQSLLRRTQAEMPNGKEFDLTHSMQSWQQRSDMKFCGLDTCFLC